MSCGEPITSMEAYQQMIIDNMAKNMAIQIDQHAIYNTTTASSTMPINWGGLPNNAYVQTTNTYGPTYGPTWANLLATPSAIERMTGLLKDETIKGISRCKSREECKELYGNEGLKFFDSMINEVLQEAIKSEETFNKRLQAEVDKYNKLKEIAIETCKEDDILKRIAVLELELLSYPYSK